MDKTTIYLPADLRLYLKDAARRKGQSQADVIRNALEAQRDSAPRQLPSSVGAFASRASEPPLTRELIRSQYHAHLDRKFPKRNAGG